MTQAAIISFVSKSTRVKKELLFFENYCYEEIPLRYLKFLIEFGK